ncbi:MAG: glutamate--tRNA ligase [Candidatus Moranbacteria bacterium CG23_combo_of_CG06-09_8_20_14_all_35_22]|nr:MAG: glutamate--tRNA ligase [Candidatus Moranbacteria bacterium CG23_combo_of_CG06-09_8_20_14_all_35_22]
MSKIRIRFAPSPTGYMHIGNFRTALYGYLFAKKNNGDFILRIEDTDQKREVADALEKLIAIINWAGFEYCEGVYFEDGKIIEKGNFGPYTQSKRLEIYKKYALQLIEKEKAYYCFCTPERLEEMRQNQLVQKQAPMYDQCCLKLSSEEIKKRLENGEKYVIRQKINTKGSTIFNDLIRGKVEIKNELLDDQILLKSDGYPTYNFANVIDDHLMEISHVFRGEEYVSSTPKYIQLYENFGWQVPEVAHLPLLLNPDKSKLSKRQGDVAVEDYIKKGYLKEAIINFVAMLGWNPGEGSTQEIFTLEELVDKFDLAHVHKAGAVFDIKKLDWINSQWIKKLDFEDLFARTLPYYEKFLKTLPSPLTPLPNTGEKDSRSYLKKILTVERDRLQNLSEVGESNQFFFKDTNFDKELLRWKDMSDDDLKKSLEKSLAVLENITDENWTRENLEKILMEKAGENRGELLWPLRATLTGEKKSPSPFECAWVLGKEETLSRLKNAIGKI